MNIDQILKKISKLSGDKILTIYLSFDGVKTPNSKNFKTQLKSLLTKKLNKKSRKEFDPVFKNLNKFFDEKFDSHNTRSVVLIAGKNLFEIFEFEFPLEPEIYVSKKPYLDPLISQIDGHSEYLVLMIDRKKARYFIVHLGNVVEHEDFVVDIVPQNVKANEERYYGRSDKIARHIEDHLSRHLDIVAERLKKFIAGKNIQFVILGGRQELFEKTRKHLPKNITDKIVAEFPFELNLPLNEVLLASKKVVDEVYREDTFEQLRTSLRGNL